MRQTRSLYILFSVTAALAALVLIGTLPNWGLEKVQAAQGGSIIYVDADASGGATGLSWSDAFTNVQDALMSAVSSDEIWVAEGVYYPDEGGGQNNDNYAASFKMKEGVALYGGFSATEILRTERSWTTNITVLSGDIDNNDTTNEHGVVTTTANITGTNSYHVITNSVTATLDGFVITAGKNPFSTTEPGGGGMFTQNSNPIIANVSFIANNSLFGGGLYNRNGSPAISNVSFIANKAETLGGGMANVDNSDPTITGVTFTSNLSYVGGGMYNDNNSNAVLTNVSFSANEAFIFGGGMNTSFSNPILTNVSFSGNYSFHAGGGMSISAGSPVLTNVSFSGNHAMLNGGALMNASSNPEVFNSIFWNNQDSSGTGTLSASIVNENSTVSLTNSLVQGSGGSSNWTTDPSYQDGGNNLDEDPLFIAPIDPGAAPTTGGNLRLQTGSPAIDSGNNDFLTIPIDLDGNPRFTDGNGDGISVVDLGPYESPDPYVIIAARNGNGDGQITSIPSGINCGITCTADFDYGDVVTLTANADLDSYFTGWSGACADVGDCVLILTQTKWVTATFVLQKNSLAVILDGNGSGAVSSQPAGIDCGLTCMANFDYGTVVTLTAIAESHSLFAGWSGACSGMGECMVMMTQTQEVTATFTLGQYSLAIILDGNGSGTVSSQPAGIDCGVICMAEFEHGTVVTLTAIADSFSVFTGWSGACTGSGKCVILMRQNQNVSANFKSTLYPLFLPVILTNQ